MTGQCSGTLMSGPLFQGRIHRFGHLRSVLLHNSGRLDRAWIGNCRVSGLAQSFFEPLEATYIHGTVVQMLLFTRFHLQQVVTGGAWDSDADNRIVARQVDDFSRFINLHYVSRCEDTPFWQHVAGDCIGQDVKDLLHRWSQRLPRRDDFVPFPGGFAHVDEQLYFPVLDGLGLLDRDVARQELTPDGLLSIVFEAFGTERKQTSGIAASWLIASSLPEPEFQVRQKS